MSATNHATVGCVFSSDDSAVAAMRALSESGVIVSWRVGATDTDRAAKIAQATGARPDLDPADPLSGLAGLASGSDAASGVNSGAVTGGVIGAVAGFFGGSTPIGSIMPVDPSLRPVAAALFFFAIGVLIGGVYGSAFGKPPSTHAGFRLIDAMEAGELAAIGAIAVDRSDDARRLLAEKGATEIVVLGAR